MKSFIFLLFLSLSSHNPIGARQRSIYVKNNLVSFGVLPKHNRRVVGIYTMYNSNRKKVCIVETHTSCGCTAVLFPQRPIGSKETVKIYLIIDTEFIRGTFEQNALLRMSDGSSVILYSKGCKKYR